MAGVWWGAHQACGIQLPAEFRRTHLKSKYSGGAQNWILVEGETIFSEKFWLSVLWSSQQQGGKYLIGELENADQCFTTWKKFILFRLRWNFSSEWRYTAG